MLRVVVDTPDYEGQDIVMEAEPMAMFVAKALSKQLVDKKIIVYHGQRIRRAYFNGYVVD